MVFNESWICGKNISSTPMMPALNAPHRAIYWLGHCRRGASNHSSIGTSLEAWCWGSVQDTTDEEPQHSSFLVSSLTTWKRHPGFSSPHITKITIFLVSIYMIYTIEDFFYKILKPGTAGISKKDSGKEIPWVDQTSRPAAVRSLNTTTNSTTQSRLISSFVHKLLWHFLKGLDIYHTDHNHRYQQLSPVLINFLQAHFCVSAWANTLNAP